MEMRYFWTCEKDAQKMYSFKWHPGMENLADYQSKHHPGAHHAAVWSYYLHEKNSPLELPRAIRPSTLKGCVGTCPKPSDQPRDAARREECLDLDEKSLTTF